MTSTQCGLVGCGRPAHDALICHQHMWELERRLRHVPPMIVDLNITLSRQSKSGPATEKVKGKGETQVAYSPDASKASDALRAALIHWARLCGMPWAEYATTSAAYLLGALPRLATYGDLPALWEQITTAYLAAERVIDAPANRTVIPVGPCPERDVESGEPCAGQVQAFIPADDRPARMACTASDGHWWSSIQWLRAGKRIRDLADRRAREERQRIAVFGGQR